MKLSLKEIKKFLKDTWSYGVETKYFNVNFGKRPYYRIYNLDYPYNIITTYLTYPELKNQVTGEYSNPLLLNCRKCRK